jgi:pre-mRNA-splicing factor ATP-dependent RNA helicase DHX38/PRP16
MGHGDDDRSTKRRKIDFNPLRSDDRFGDLPSRTQSGGFRGSNSSNGAFNSRSSTPRSRFTGAETPRRQDPGAPSAREADQVASNALDRDWYGGDDDLGGHTFGDDSHNPFGGENSW